MYIKENEEYSEINKDDIEQILNHVLNYILGKKQSHNANVYNYSYIGTKLKKKCRDIGFILYNRNKKIRNINNYLIKEYSGLKNYLLNHYKHIE